MMTTPLLWSPLLLLLLFIKFTPAVIFRSSAVPRDSRFSDGSVIDDYYVGIQQSMDNYVASLMTFVYPRMYVSSHPFMMLLLLLLFQGQLHST